MAGVEEREVRGRREEAGPGPGQLSLGAGLSGPAVGGNVGPGRLQRGRLRSCSKRDGGGRAQTGSGRVGLLECVSAVKMPQVTSGCVEGTSLVTQHLTLSHCASACV